jgi:site-specific DNA recombinase
VVKPPEWLGASAAEQNEPRVVRAAFAARVSTDDQQDPTLSLPRQLANCQKALPDGMVVILHFYDVESGRYDPDRRGTGVRTTHPEVPIPRDGGIDDLLTEANRPDRRFDVVIRESVDRIARITYYGTKIEHELGQAGVLLLAADEGISIKPRDATTILTRRMKQCIAEWYVLNMLEQSWGGLEEHTKQGWNIGQAPYGYLADRVPHPVPARRAEGQHKIRLVLDPDRATTVQTIYDLRITERLGYRAIADRLNADPPLHPTPIPPNPARAAGRWTGSSVREILHNPKYTGHMVWNRRASKTGGRVNPISEWVLSPEPMHPAIVTPDEYAAALAVAQDRERSRSGHQPNPHPATKRTYALRSYIVCASCGRRMWGKHVHGKTYYCCQTSDSALAHEHPASIVVRETALLAALNNFVNTRLLGTNRRALLTASLVEADRDAIRDRTERLATIEREIATISATQNQLLAHAESGTTDPFTVRVRHRYNELDVQRRTQENTRTRLNTTEAPPDASTMTALLDYLPLVNLNLTAIPRQLLRDLCDTLRIKITYERHTGLAHHSAEISTTTMPHILTLLARITPPGNALSAGPNVARNDACALPASNQTVIVTGTTALPPPKDRRSRHAPG